MSYNILEQKKCLFRLQKQEVKKVKKIAIFPKGVVHGFGQKLASFPSFVSGQYNRVKCVLQYFRTKKRLFTLQKQEVQKVEKLPFFQNG